VTAPDALLREALAKLTALESDIERERSYNGRAVDTDESAIELREAIVALAATPPASAERDAVVEAAERARDTWARRITDGTTRDAYVALWTAVDALRAAEARDVATPPASAVAYTNATAEDYVMAEPTPPAEPADRGWSPRSKSTS
jgi:hypothetical protein